MDNEKLVVGGVILIGLVLAGPFIYPLIVDTTAKNAAIDAQSAERLSKAVNNYARINQQYPPSLHHLVPDYLAEVPLTTANRQFQYDPRTGKVSNPSPAPAQGNTQNAGRRGTGGGGGSLATESMTGLGVSEELNF